jgi:CubicO group peptidase (beta-lactamase class C family)
MHNGHPVVLLALILTACVVQRTVAQEIDEQQAAKIHALFAEVDTPGSAGASLAVAKGGRIIYANGYGYANLEYDVPIIPSTVFHVASVSKQFTAFAVALLADRGELSLDDDIRKHLPELPDFGHKITLKHLIFHTSGIRDQWSLLQIAGWRMDDVITTEQIMTMLGNQRELNFDPGAEHTYSNSGYTLLAQVVERVTGESFSEWTRKNIFEPLEMTGTHFHDDHQMIVKNRAYSYAKTEDGFKNIVLSYATVGPSEKAKKVAEIVLGDVIKTAEGDHTGADTDADVEVDSRIFDRYVGKYAVESFGILEILVEDDCLKMQLGDRKHELLQRSETEYDVKFATLAFHVEEDGSVERFRFIFGGSKLQSFGRRLNPPNLSAAELAAYTGDYFSEELHTTYRLMIEDGGLVAWHPRVASAELVATDVDRFAGDRLNLCFARNDVGAVNGFLLTGPRVRNLRFKKVE